MKTWKVEMLFVASVLLVCNMIAGSPKGLELLAALAVLLSFGHAQIADRLAEKEDKRSVPEVECYKKLWYYFLGKEACWFLFFLLSHAYSALAGVFIFLAYPFWRKVYRAHVKPL